MIENSKKPLIISGAGVIHSKGAEEFREFVAVEHLGKTELAISNITRSVSAVFFVIVNSFAVTTGSLVSNAIGAGERRAVFIICRKILRLGYSVGFPLIGVAVCDL